MARQENIITRSLNHTINQLKRAREPKRIHAHAQYVSKLIFKRNDIKRLLKLNLSCPTHYRIKHTQAHTYLRRRIMFC